MRKIIILYMLFFFISCSTDKLQEDEDSLVLQGNRLTLNKVGSKAFTDLVYFNNIWFITFRESDLHINGKDGKIKIYSSLDGINWKLNRVFFEKGVDLRDPKFSVKGNQLYFYIHGSIYDNNKLVSFKDYMSEFVSNEWSDTKPVYLDNTKLDIDQIKGNESWPWRITWGGDIAYVFGYNLNGIFDLYTSSDGVNFINRHSYFMQIKGLPTEATIRINDKDELYALVRRNNGNAVLLKSTNKDNLLDALYVIPIYSLGGPNFQFYKNGIIISGRENEKVILGYFDLKKNEYKKLKTFESGGDCSYPGMVIKDNELWISYYSGHETESGSSIYLERINLENLIF